MDFIILNKRGRGAFQDALFPATSCRGLSCIDGFIKNEKMSDTANTYCLGTVWWERIVQIFFKRFLSKNLMFRVCTVNAHTAEEKGMLCVFRGDTSARIDIFMNSQLKEL